MIKRIRLFPLAALSFIQEAVWSRLTRTVVVLSVASVIPLISPTWATRVQAQSIEVGGKVGLNRATVGGVRGVGTRMGIATGGFVTLMLGRHFAIQPELLYSLKGYKALVGVSRDNGNIRQDLLTTTLAYIEVPVQGSILIPLSPGNAPRLRVSVGPSAAFRVSCARTIHSTLFEPVTGLFLGETSQEVACDGIYKNTDFALMFGAGVDVPLAGGRVTADARTTLGLTSISSTGLDVKNRVFAVLVGFGYRIRR